MFDRLLDMWCEFWGKLRELALPRERVIGGVCEAFGRATPIPAWMWRAGFLMSVVYWGTGVIAYFILMIAIPNERKQTS